VNTIEEGIIADNTILLKTTYKRALLGQEQLLPIEVKQRKMSIFNNLVRTTFSPTLCEQVGRKGNDFAKR
jgi:hypothetical protein